MNTLSDPRLARCSQFARDILQRIQNIYSLEDLLADDWRVPAAPAQLRQTCFSSDDTTLDPHIGRGLHELELCGIVILRRQSRRIRSLRLCLDFTSAPVNNSPLIHNPRAGPDERASKIIAVAAAASSSSDLISALSEHFPLHNLATEFDRYYAYRQKLGKPAIATGFAKWMLRAEVPLKKPARKPEVRSQRSEVIDQKSDLSLPAVAGPQTSADQMHLFTPLPEERARIAFLSQYQERKARKHGSSIK